MMFRVSRNPEHGGAMLVTLIVIASTMAGAAVLVSLQMSANRSTDITRTGISALYCAEAGLAAARSVVASNYENWPSALAQPTTEPAWIANAFSHDIDSPPDGVSDFKITLKDNDDEMAAGGTTNNPNNDVDLRVFIISQCTKYPDSPKTVSELLHYNPAMNCYESQEGGCNARGNANR